jgi:hypothetical protein
MPMIATPMMTNHMQNSLGGRARVNPPRYYPLC